MSLSRIRPWLSPLTTVTFIAIGFTGVLMFFHVRSGAINVLHEFAGLLFVLAGLLHLVVNWKALLGYLKQRSAQLSLVGGVVVCAVLLLLGTTHQEGHEHGPRGRAAQFER
ncbi:MAG: DUF4405 domain-containing protein [Polyangiaceae bacterium]